MRGIAFLGNKQVALSEFPDPTPSSGEVIIEVKASGMCGSDLHNYRKPEKQTALIIAGHEPAGVVAAVGPGVRENVARLGQRVMVHHYHGCTACAHCRTGWPQLCTTAPVQVYGVNANGAHAPYLKVPADTLVSLDDSLSFMAGAAIACGTGTAWGALRRMKLSGRDTLAVFGQGPVGLSATLLASAQGARVIALDIEPRRLEKARDFGADVLINPKEQDSIEAIKAVTSGQGASKALETSGSSIAARDALACLDKWGIACFVGLGAEVKFDVREFLRSQMTVLTSWTMSIVGQKKCADFIVDRSLDIDRLFTDHWKLEQAEEAYRHFDLQNSGKGVFLV
ncbi:MAG: zinc-binding dehydrogenase [Acidobacteriaceae bacterium]|nr:zinc-binding dehydrogenase [Acidobacteriaceae bacterium]